MYQLGISEFIGDKEIINRPNIANPIRLELSRETNIRYEYSVNEKIYQESTQKIPFYHLIVTEITNHLREQNV